MDVAECAAYWEGNAEAWAECAGRGLDVHRDALNTPAFLEMLPDVRGLEGLDIGCGDGSNTRQVARRGARMRGVDIAPTFVRYARAAEEAERLGVEFVVGDGMRLPFADESFDFATAFMSLMDMPEPGRALSEAARVVRPGGFVQFSILHPCFAPPRRRVVRDEAGRARAIEVAGYFDNVDGQVETWWFGELPKEERERVKPFRTPRFQRTLSAWVEMTTAAGLRVEKMGEPMATEEAARRHPAVEDTRVAPLFLLVRGRKG